MKIYKCTKIRLGYIIKLLKNIKRIRIIKYRNEKYLRKKIIIIFWKLRSQYNRKK